MSSADTTGYRYSLLLLYFYSAMITAQGQPQPWMANKRDISCNDLHSIIYPNGLTKVPSNSMDEILPNLYIGDR